MNNQVHLRPDAPLTPSLEDCSVSPTLDDRTVADLTDQLEEIIDVPVGHGGYSDVYLYRSRGIGRETAGNRIFAVKTARMKFFVGDKDKAIRRIRREIGVWTALDHPNVLKLHGTLFRENHPLPSLVSDFMEKSTAERYLRDNAEANILRLIHDIAKGLSYLHKKDIAHGDIKSNNVLIGQDGNARIADFGLSRMLGNDGIPIESTTTDGNRFSRWTAPEYFESGPDVSQSLRSYGPNKAADVWSFGCTVLELLSGRVPYFDAHEAEVIFRLHRKELPRFPPTLLRPDFEKYRPGIFVLCQFCWVRNPSQRSPMSVIESIICSYCAEDDCYGPEQSSHVHRDETSPQAILHESSQTSGNDSVSNRLVDPEADGRLRSQTSFQSMLVPSLNDSFDLLVSEVKEQRSSTLDSPVVPAIRIVADPAKPGNATPRNQFPDLPSPLLETRIKDMQITPQGVLNRLAQSTRKLIVEYVDGDPSGPGNLRTHVVKCIINGKERGIGRVRGTKKHAKEKAALAALEALCEEDPAQWPRLRYYPILMNYLKNKSLDTRASWRCQYVESAEDPAKWDCKVTFDFDGTTVAVGVGTTLEKAEEDVAQKVGMAWSDAVKGEA